LKIFLLITYYQGTDKSVVTNLYLIDKQIVIDLFCLSEYYLHRQNAMNRISSKLSAQSGFSLLEMLIVVVILGIIMTQAAPKFRSGPDTQAYTNATRAVMSVSRAAALGAIANATKDVIFKANVASSTDRYVMAFVDEDANGDWTAGTDNLIAEYHLVAGSYMELKGGGTTMRWKFISARGTASLLDTYGTIYLSSSKSKSDPAAAYLTTDKPNWTTLTVATGSNRVRECFKAYECP